MWQLVRIHAVRAMRTAVSLSLEALTLVATSVSPPAPHVVDPTADPRRPALRIPGAPGALEQRGAWPTAQCPTSAVPLRLQRSLDVPISSVFFLALAPRQIKPTLPEAKQRTSIQFLLGDATEIDWSDATMWFANSTCFDEELMRKLAVVSGGCLAHGCGRCGPPCPLPSHTLSHVRSRHPLPHTRFPVPLRQASCGDLRDYLYKAPALGQVDRAGARGTGMG
jgi:hypothetical protein